MECAYYFGNRGWCGWMGDFRCGAVRNELRWAGAAEDSGSTKYWKNRASVQLVVQRSFCVGRDFVLVGDTPAIQMATCVTDQSPIDFD